MIEQINIMILRLISFAAGLLGGAFVWHFIHSAIFNL